MGAFVSGCCRTAEPPLHRRHLGGGRARRNAVRAIAAAPRSQLTSGERRIEQAGGGSAEQAVGGARHHVPGQRGEERVYEALSGAALGRIRAAAAGASARALALGRLGPGQPLGQLGFTQSGPQGRVRGALGALRAGGGAAGGGARRGAAGRGGAGHSVTSTTRSPQRSTSKIKENKHPFALYGWGERQMDMGSQKTHNVCASASVHEIHESALRAKNRRQVEKRKLAAQRQRAHSVDVEKNQRVKPASAENPWLTEYMRCYSARA